MRPILSLLVLMMSLTLSAQAPEEEKQVQQTIEGFFKGFHAQDYLQMKEVLADQIVVQTIGKTKQGEDTLVQAEIGKVLHAIASIPETVDFKETIHGYKIQVDGPMANAWTPYSFHLNGNLSHCGVNNFQLAKLDGRWKIIYLIDTRRKEGCSDL